MVIRQQKAKRRVGSNVPEKVGMLGTFEVSVASASHVRCAHPTLRMRPGNPSVLRDLTLLATTDSQRGNERLIQARPVRIRFLRHVLIEPEKWVLRNENM